MLSATAAIPPPDNAALRWADIVDQPQIRCWRPASNLRKTGSRPVSQAGVELVVAYEANQISTVLALVEEQVGVAVPPAYARVGDRPCRSSGCA